tara:strand:- start:1429 stop:1839 length:411 start_codon:yes stop_codon:yes gene_type:complete
MKKVLVLCTGNSCRSIMAEALINQLGKGRYEAVSAGSSPAGYIHPKSLEVLKKHAIDYGNPKSKSWDVFSKEHFDIVITVCDEAANETCPLFLGNSEKIHWSIPDPAKKKGSNIEINEAFNSAYYLLKENIEKHLL